jgi:hypothetical protein
MNRRIVPPLLIISTVTSLAFVFAHLNKDDD